MEKKMKGGDNTICNTLRVIYHMTSDEGIRLKCRLAFSMGKAMCDRLMYYHNQFNSPITEFEELRGREPAPEWEMDKRRWEGHHSVCQMIRDIYHMTDSEQMKFRCRVAMAMTKAMNEKLKWYKQKGEENVANS